MTPARPDLDAIKRRADGATAGPWKPGRSDMQSYDGETGEPFTNVYADDPNGKWHMGSRLPLVIARVLDESGRNKADADFIARARQDISALVAWVEHLEATLRWEKAPKHPTVERVMRMLKAEFQTAAHARLLDLLNRATIGLDGHYLHCPGEKFHGRPEHDCRAIQLCEEIRAALTRAAPRKEGT